MIDPNNPEWMLCYKDVKYMMLADWLSIYLDRMINGIVSITFKVSSSQGFNDFHASEGVPNKIHHLDHIWLHSNNLKGIDEVLKQPRGYVLAIKTNFKTLAMV